MASPSPTRRAKFILVVCSTFISVPAVLAQPEEAPSPPKPKPQDESLLLGESSTKFVWPEWYSELAYAPIDVSELCEQFRQLILAERYGRMLGDDPIDPTIEFDAIPIGFVLGDVRASSEADSSDTILDEKFALGQSEDGFVPGDTPLPPDFFSSESAGLRGGLDLMPADEISGPLASEVDSLAFPIPPGP